MSDQSSGSRTRDRIYRAAVSLNMITASENTGQGQEEKVIQELPQTPMSNVMRPLGTSTPLIEHSVECPERTEGTTPAINNVSKTVNSGETQANSTLDTELSPETNSGLNTTAERNRQECYETISQISNENEHY